MAQQIKKTFKRAGNHLGNDTAFYLYLTEKDHDLVTSKGKYKAKWNNTTNAFTIIEFIEMKVKEQPKKLTYTEGENLDLSGLIVTLTDIDDNPKDVKFKDFGTYGIQTDLENGTRLIAANHNNATVKLTYKNLSAYTDPLTVKAKYTVTYKDGVDGKAFADQVNSNIVTGADTPAFNGGTPTREGYVFAGWSPDVAEKVTANVTYKATWKEDKNHNNRADEDEDKYTVTYADGVDGQEIFPDQVASGILSGNDTPKFNGTPSREGYVFAGWNPTFAAKVTADVKYVAQWKKDHFTVIFKDGDKIQTVKVEIGKAIDTDVLIDQSMPKNPTKDGYTFKEWNTKEDGKGEKFTGASVVKGDMTMYAIYTKDSVPTPDLTSNPPTPELKLQSDAPAPKAQPKKHIGMIPKTGESASFAGLPAAPASAATDATPVAGSASATKSEESKNTSNDSAKDENQKESEDSKNEDSKNEDSKDEDSKDEDSKSEDAKNSDKSAQASGANNGEHAAGNNITLIAAVAGSITAGIAVLGFSIARLAILRKKKMMEESK